MDSLLALARHRPETFVHLVSALLALVLGLVILSRRKGTRSHRGWGWTWVVLMALTTLSSAFIRDTNMPNLAGFTPIHGLTAFVAYQLPMAVVDIRQGRVDAHRKRMRGLLIGGCIVAGLFTLMPGRFLGQLLWRQGLGLL